METTNLHFYQQVIHKNTSTSLHNNLKVTLLGKADKVIIKGFFMLVLPRRTFFLTTFYSLYCSHHHILHITNCLPDL